MSLSFFQALNPLSIQSGIKYSLAKEYYSDQLNIFRVLPLILSQDFPCQKPRND
ncbi:hypothetical protein LDG_5611 [Legionella drancourtii LLAP12]|uniref:Uncharacterized protein n=1 Tax=Legionella drancourtii LLAP12 TaxID=658187 RepID=G9EK87_9GAMM|nr:hypothetical protein LDG_5611 [Legionella drancourtii LLAP12]